MICLCMFEDCSRCISVLSYSVDQLTTCEPYITEALQPSSLQVYLYTTLLFVTVSVLVLIENSDPIVLLM
ncbi:hypothetical protein GJ496_002809 [Pomphorhynchus laevis]|nr:hypothetical protein GJ496_002809 [Pomphorhynchus laevis]